MNSVVHFEVPVDDLDRAKKFYSQVFGWQLQDIPDMGYVIVRTTPTDENQMPQTPGAINGGMMKRSDKVKGPVITIDVPNIDEYLKTIEEAGGKVVTPKIAVGDMGFSAYVQDTEGNVIGVWQSMRNQ